MYGPTLSLEFLIPTYLIVTALLSLLEQTWYRVLASRVILQQTISQ